MPEVNKKDVESTVITEVSILSSSTVVSIRARASSQFLNGGWVCLSGGVFLRVNGKKYKMTNSEGIPRCPGRHQFKTQYDAVNFKVEFEKIPNGTISFDLIETELERGFNFYGVTIGKEKNSDYSFTKNALLKHWEENGSSELEGIYLREKRVDMYSRYYGKTNSFNKTIKEEYYVVKLGEKHVLRTFTTDFYSELLIIPGTNKLFLKTTEYSLSRIKNNNITANRLDSEQFSIKDYKTVLDDDEWVIYNDIYTRIYKPEIKINLNTKAFGTGFGVSEDGYIVTNYHVIEGSKQIIVKGINGDFVKEYTADIVVSDKQNDLSILKINNLGPLRISEVPFRFKSSAAVVGNKIFVLGYPMRQSMGDDIKLTDGIISSKSGYNGDVTSFQISAPIQPGSSGGPLLDKNGFLVGVVNSKHVLAENASYAIKASYLNSLFDLVDNLSLPNTLSGLSDLTLSEQTKILQKFIYVIEVEL